jgi:hypothetical protein
MKYIFVFIFLLASNSSYADKYIDIKNGCSYTQGYIPKSNPLDNYTWKHWLDENHSTYVFSPKNQINPAYVEVHLCARASHGHLLRLEEEVELDKSYNKSQPQIKSIGWVTVNEPYNHSGIGFNCKNGNDIYCLTFVTFVFDDDVTAQVELRYKNNKEKEMLFSWANSLTVIYDPQKDKDFLLTTKEEVRGTN